MGPQEAVDSNYYLPRIACYGLYQGWSPDLWMLTKTPSQKKTLHFFSVAYVFIFPITVTRIVPDSHEIPCYYLTRTQ